MSIPNVIHFIFGLEEQTEDFLFVYYLSVYSAYITNKPEKIYLYYHFVPEGEWWEKLKEIPGLELVKVSLPEYIGRHKILKTAHRADKLRMDVLFEYGGVYMDIDTISVRPYKDLLQHETVLGLEEIRNNPKAEARWGKYKGICNAVMFTRPKSQFFKEWIDLYETVFNPNGWRPRAECRNGNIYCHHEPAPRGSKTGTQGKKNAYFRSMVPQELCDEILNN